MIGATIGPYRITELLGAGGMGSVYRGVHAEHGGGAAIKTVTAPRESLLPALRREILALGRLRHPGIVQILDSGTDSGIPWYAMPLLERRSLADVRDALWERGAPPPDELRGALTLVRRLCEPLAYLHGEGIVHGDIKPDNVLCAADGRPVLIDFGLLTAHGEHGRDAVDGRAHAAGSLAYMAPEQLAGEPIDARADLYAVGCVLYELLTGRPPYDHARVDALVRAQQAGPPPPPGVRGLPRELDELVLRLLAARPRDRIGHAEDVAARLGALGAEASAERGPRPRPYLYRPGLAGRRHVLDSLADDVAASFAAGHGGLAVVVGESGIGKTRLVVELTRRAAAAGVRVLSGGCARGGATALARPLQAVVDRCRSEGPDEARRLLAGRARVLARHQPALAGLPGLDGEPDAPELPFEAARALVSHALWATFAALAEDRPLLLVLDDLQWADELTLAFLAALAPARARVFVVGTARSDELTGALEQRLGRGDARRIDLDRLDEDDVRGMVGDMLATPSPGDALVRFVARHAEGNPFFVAEYLRAALRDGLIARDARGRFRLVDEAALAALPLPRSLRELVVARLDGLGAEARRVVDVAAVLGRDVDAARVTAVAALDAAAFTRATSELVARQVLEDAGDGLRFSHDKLREVALDSLAVEARASLHRAAAAVLAAGTEPGAAGLAAGHWLAAGDEARAAPLLLAAARRSVVECDNERAQEHYRRVLAIVDGPANDAVARELAARRALWDDPEDPGGVASHDDAAVLREVRRIAHRGLGDALTVSGRLDDAIAEYDAALAEAAEDGARADALARLGAACFAKGELLLAARRLTEALAHLGSRVPTTRPGVLASIGASTLLLIARLVRRRPLGSPRARAVERLRVRILNRLTYIHYSFDLERAAATHLAALAAAERVADSSDAAETFAHHGPLFAGHLPASARFHVRRAVEVCRREGHLAMQMTAEFMAGMCFAFQAEWDEAAGHFRAAIDLYPRVGDGNVLQTAHENLAYVLLYRGDHRDALVEASHSLTLAERTGDLRGTVNSGCHVALAHLRLGDVAQARRVADEALASLAALDDPVVHCILHTVRGRIERAAGAEAEARVALARAVAIADEHRLAQEEVVPAYTELLEVYATMPAAPPETARLLATARRIGRRFPAHAGALLRAEALLLAQRGEPRAARRTLARSVEVLHGRGMRDELARTRDLMARLA